MIKSTLLCTLALGGLLLTGCNKDEGTNSSTTPVATPTTVPAGTGTTGSTTTLPTLPPMTMPKPDQIKGAASGAADTVNKGLDDATTKANSGLDSAQKTISSTTQPTGGDNK